MTLELLNRLWAPPPALGGAEWAETERELGPDESPSRPGRMRLIPWQREILDALADPHLDWLAVLKAAQVGLSELVRCAIGRWARVDPGDVLWVMATENAARKAMVKLRAMFRNTPTLRPLVSDRKWDSSLLEMRLTNGMRIVIGWAGSAQSLASDPFRYVILDETGLYPAKVGAEGSPIGLAEERTKTFGRQRKVVLLSKPSHPDDLICTAYEQCRDRREFAVPCGKCGSLDPITWERVRWPGGDPESAPHDVDERLALADEIDVEQTAWVACLAPSCDGVTSTHTAMHDTRSTWVRVGESTESTSRKRGYHISELYHWSRTPSDIAARFLNALRPSDLQNFYTGTLGIPMRSERSDLEAGLFRRRATHPDAIVPEWANVVIATADTQADCWWWMVRAWGTGSRSRLLGYGRAETTGELLQSTLLQRWKVEGRNAHAAASVLVIDSGGGDAGGALDGSRTQVVYELAARQASVIAMKGASTDRGSQEIDQVVKWSRVQFSSRGSRPREIKLMRPASNYWKDVASTLICATDPVLWEESHAAGDKEYGRQMTGQRQVWEEDTKGRGRWVWRKRRRKPDHLWDCAWMQVVAAEELRAGELTGAAWRPEENEEPPDRRKQGKGWPLGRRPRMDR